LLSGQPDPETPTTVWNEPSAPLNSSQLQLQTGGSLVVVDRAVPETPSSGGALLIGRDTELARIDTFLDSVKTGNGRLLTLVGPAGVGKSRLIEEAVRRARLAGFRVVHGTASPHQENVSYAPLVEALRPLVNEGQQLEDRQLIEGLADLCRLFPDLPIGPPKLVSDAGLERTRLSEAVWRLLTRAARQRPLMVVLEDLHCADGGSISTLGYLARGLEGFPLLLLAASRPVSDSNDSAAQFLRATPSPTQLEIAPFDATGIRIFVEQHLGGPASSDLVLLLETRTQGIPLFVQGLLTMLVETARLARMGGIWTPLPGAEIGVPAGAADLFATRLAAFSEADRRLIQAIAVCGDAATIDVLQQVSDVPAAEARLADLVLKGVVLERVFESDVLYAASHPLLAEVAYEQLPEPARLAMHAKAARLVQHRWPGEVSRLAAHVSRAGSAIPPDEVLTVLTTATSVALQRLAGQEAMQHAEAAVAIAEKSSRSDVLARLHEQLAEAAALSGLPERSSDAYGTAAKLTNTPLEQARLFRKAALVAWQLGSFDAAHAHLDQADNALGGLGGINAIDERILVAGQRFYLAIRETNHAEVVSAVAQLRILADAHPLPLNRANILVATLPTRFSGTDLIRAMEKAYSDDVVERATQLGDPVLLAHTHRAWIMIALISGDIPAARQRALIARRHAQQLGSAVYEASPTMLGGWAEFLGGEWNRALHMAEEARSIAYRTAAPRDRASALALHAMILVRRGHIREARRDIAEARTVFGSRDRNVSGTLETVEAVLCLSTGNVDRAVELVSRLTLFTAGYIPLISAQVRAAVFLASGDLRRANEVVAFLRESGNHLPHIRAQAARLEGLIAGTNGDSRVAGEKLSAAAEQLTGLGMPFDAALASVELAEFTSDPAPAEQALTVLDLLEAKPLADRARGLLGRLGQPATPRSRKRAGGLSGREREVALLVAQGLSTSTIAERLGISPRTVSTHLDRIYRQLGLQTREALTRYVMEQLPNT
jgi:DNA-binding CsgD family transcriptional regulator/tetratricopeptide (TPR) repeat protein